MSIESAIFREAARYVMTVALLDEEDEQKSTHGSMGATSSSCQTSLSSGQSTSAIFDVHSFNLGDVRYVTPQAKIEFKAYKID